jgi:hypothetical protein
MVLQVRRGMHANFRYHFGFHRDTRVCCQLYNRVTPTLEQWEQYYF